MPDRKQQFLLALYSILLRLYPASFRNQFGQEMLDAFSEVLEGRGTLAAFSLLMSDLLPTLLREHLEDCSSILLAIRGLLCLLPPIALYALVLAHIQNLDEFGLITFW